MGLFTDVQEFVHHANRVKSTAELQSLLGGATSTLGFDYYALVHHASRHTSGPEPIRITDYPDYWTDLIVARGYFTDDPVFAASEKVVSPFEGSELGDIIELTPRHLEILEAARTSGVGDAFFVPVHVPGEYTGSCRFAMKTGRHLPENLFPAAQYVGCFAFEAARRLRRDRAKAKDEQKAVQRLTQRQFDCLVLVAKGKSDWDIARLLGISDQTVHKHIEESKRRYRVSTRMQLVVRALFNSHLTFGDVLN
jgi:LuxR family quorum-sensing system transcriptional regulator CciR